MLSQNQRTRFGNLLILSAVLIFSPFEENIFVSHSQAQSSCESTVAEAEKLYEAGLFSKTVAVLRPCLPDSIKETQRVRAFKVLALAYIAEDHIAEAENAVRDLLGRDPFYQPDPNQDSQPFVELVNRIKKRLQGRIIKLIRINYGYPLLIPSDFSNTFDQSSSFASGLEILVGKRFFCGLSFDFTRFVNEPSSITGGDSPEVVGTFRDGINGQFYALVFMYKSSPLTRRWEIAPFVMLKAGYLTRKYDPGIVVHDETRSSPGNIDDDSFAQTIAIGMEVPVKSSFHAFASFNYFSTRKYKSEDLNYFFNYSKSYLTGSVGALLSF